VALAEFLCVCVDSADATRIGPWWADRLALDWQPHGQGSPARGEAGGPSPGQRILFLDVPEPKATKNRVHLDIYVRTLAELEAAGAVVVEPQQPGWRWTVMADPEGGEFCAFLRDVLPAERLHGLVVDSVNATEIARWWAEVYGADLDHHKGGGWSTVEHIAGMPIDTFDFVPVPEPKTVKNRIHWDVTAPDVDALVAHGATVLRRPDEEIGWTVLADPEGNEFCAFEP
jgi:hypothetical protein